MQQLALGGGRFEIGLVPIEGGASVGLEHIEFRIAGLAGNEAGKSLAKVASGGELSRISLAIQVVTAQGAERADADFRRGRCRYRQRAAEAVGRLLRELGKSGRCCA